MNEITHLKNIKPVLQLRHNVLNAVREFFTLHDYIEIETPVRIEAPAPEIHIDAETSGTHYLRTSPELHMKRMLAAGYERIFQLGSCFRAGEKGPRHQPEYSMLEWYHTGTDYMGILSETRDLILHCAERTLNSSIIHYQGTDIDLSAEWEIHDVNNLYQRLAGWDPSAAYDADQFDLDMIEKIEPNLRKDIPVIIKDYPSAAAALSRRKPSHPQIAERWELYIAGIELANAYSELTDPEEQKKRFSEWNAWRAENGKDIYPNDNTFFKALNHDIPECGGIALGIDRLVMLFADCETLDGVLPFRGECL